MECKHKWWGPLFALGCRAFYQCLECGETQEVESKVRLWPPTPSDAHHPEQPKLPE
jgi:hypothetical protein